MLKLIVLLILAVCSVQSIMKTVDWQSGDNGFVRWSHNCDITGDEVESHKSLGEDCGSLCLADTRKWCNSFVWNSDNGGTCRLKRIGTSAPGNYGGVCGEIIFRPETGKLDFFLPLFKYCPLTKTLHSFQTDLLIGNQEIPGELDGHRIAKLSAVIEKDKAEEVKTVARCV